MGFTGIGLVGDLPLIFAFVILAAYTYTSGLRAPAMIAIVKDILIYITVIAAVIIIPKHLGGFTVAGYAAFYSLLVNLATCVVLTFVFRFRGVAQGIDATAAEDYDEKAADMA